MTSETSSSSCQTRDMRRSSSLLWLQGITIGWMLAECGISLFAASRACSPALLAFGSDSFVELLSAALVLLQFSPRVSISGRPAVRIAAILLFALATIVTVIAVVSLAGNVQPEASRLGIGLTVVALLVMPVLGWLKRQEARRLNNPALAADAVQSATCAYLAGIALIGLGLNAAFHIGWFDSAAALLAVPLLLKEGREAWRGQACGCL
jgi:divalent metal cation (Fe/Co/Zn/Cd) transporter